jgi:hypothetical protein
VRGEHANTALPGTAYALAAVLLLHACALWAPPDHGKLAADSRVALSVSLAAGYLHLQVKVAPRCLAAAESCPEGRPVSDLAVSVKSETQGVQPLGQTWSDGGLDVSFAQLEPLFPAHTVTRHKLAPLLVEGREVADLPIGDVHQYIIDLAVQECDEALADQYLDPDYAQELLGRMFDLQLLGMSDKRLKERSAWLTARIRAKPERRWSHGHGGARRAGELLEEMRARHEADAVPAQVQAEIASGLSDDSAVNDSVRWALDWLPTMCMVGVEGGGAIVGNVALTNPPGIALMVLGAAAGHVFSDWLIESCCKRFSRVLGAEKPPDCH